MPFLHLLARFSKIIYSLILRVQTGTGSNGAVNDIAVMWPPDRSPIFVAVYYSGSPSPNSDREAVLAEVGKLIAIEFNKRSH